MRTITWDPEIPVIRMIDQRLLPEELVFIDLHTPEAVASAIRQMSIRGAPAIGAAAAYGLALAGIQSIAQTSQALMRDLETAAELLQATRPTAKNLSWALNRLRKSALDSFEDGPETMRQRMVEEAQLLADEDVEINQRIGEYGSSLIQDGDQVIHHCNTGALATVDYGTALGVIRTAHEQGKRVHVLVDETRPRLQGSRLTAWELSQYGIPYEIISDNAAGYFLARGLVSAVFVGADRVAANGDVANKIGTYMLALAAKDNHVPLYCAVPTSTVDLEVSSGADIPIEERDPSEVLGLQIAGRITAPEGSSARNPAFDITPNRLITSFITEVGILPPPYTDTLANAVRKAQPR
jgi:methylthioribose-1-phosphate isomerase